MTTIFARITSTEFIASLFVAFLLLIAGKCFSQTAVTPASKSYSLEVSLQPEKANFSLRLEVETDAELALSLHDEFGAQLGVLLQKTELHSGVYFFDLKKWAVPGGVYFVKNGNENLMQFDVPGCSIEAGLPNVVSSPGFGFVLSKTP